MKSATCIVRLLTHRVPSSNDDSLITLSKFQDNAHLVRDVYAYFPILMKYTDLHRAQWLKSPSWETDGIYENVAIIFKVIKVLEIFKLWHYTWQNVFEV